MCLMHSAVFVFVGPTGMRKYTLNMIILLKHENTDDQPLFFTMKEVYPS